MRYFDHTEAPSQATPAHDEFILKGMEKLAISAGRQLMTVLRAGAAAAPGADGGAVDDVAYRAESTILRGLAELFGNRVCIARETLAAGIAPRRLGREFFLVDALDGGRALQAGRTDFTVNIALIRDHLPAIGGVFAPARRELYTGWQGGAALALLERDLRRSRTGPIAVRAQPRQPRIFASRVPLTAGAESYLRAWPQAELVVLGSSLKFCLIASGEADLYPCFARSMEWDTAAGHAVLLAAGGRVHGADRQPLTYGKIAQADVDFAHPWFVALGGVATRQP